MLAILDVDYRGDKAISACLVFDWWPSERPIREFTIQVRNVAPYEPGAFYKRELPCLMAALEKVTEPITAVVIDGNVWLDAGKPGLGAHLHNKIQLPVVGIAKTQFKDGKFAVEVLRGESKKPLYVTSAGMEARNAAQHVMDMHGDHRVPTLARRVDRLCRES